MFRSSLPLALPLLLPSVVLAFGWVPGYGHSEGHRLFLGDMVEPRRPKLDPSFFCESGAWLWPRQMFCGPGVGVCEEGFCCTGDGRCSSHFHDCLAPACQLDYGPACHGNQGPRSGVDTSVVPRPRVGALPYGGWPNTVIWGCTQPGTIAVTYDDGPSTYTEDLLDLLRTRHPDAHVTFFVVGNNGGRGGVNDESYIWPGLLRRMVAEGHQVASHTWTHENSSRLDEAHMMEQMVWTEVALNEALGGFFPTYMRPPYDECSPSCEAVMDRLGYHVVYQTVNNEDWRWNDPTLIQRSKDNWDAVLARANPAKDSLLTLEHDMLYQTVYNLSDYVFTTMREKGWRAVTVGECLGDPKENWYRTGPKVSP